MSGFTVDSTDLSWFAAKVDELAQQFTQSGSNAVPSSLLPDPNRNNPNIGQRGMQFRDAANVYLSYEDYRDQFLGDPSQLIGSAVADPSASSLAAFVSGLQHLVSTANAIAKNYNDTQSEDHFNASQVNALLNTDPPATVTGSGT